MFEKTKEIGNGRMIARVHVRRTSVGLVITARSQVLEEWARSVARKAPTGEPVTFGSPMGTPAYAVYGNDRLIPGADFGFPTRDLRRDGNVLIGWTLLQGLTDGVTWEVTGVYSREAVSGYLSDTRDALAHLYQEYIAPSETEVEIVARWTATTGGDAR